MDWRTHYHQRTISADEAAAKIQSGQSIVFGHAIAEPTAFKDALIRNHQAYSNVEIIHMVCMGQAEYCKPDMASHFRHNAIFAGARTKDAIAQGRGDYTPSHFSHVPYLYRSGLVPVDVFSAQVSEPDAHGYVSLGVSVDYAPAAIDAAKTVIVQVNPEMPRTMGDSFVHVSDIDWFIHQPMPLVELGRPAISETEQRIGKHIASLIEDGCTLQLGIGSLPDAVLLFLKDKNDLGIHSEMVSDGVMELMQAGVVTGKRKTLHPKKAVVTFFMGTKELYTFLDYNPAFQIMPVEYVNDPYVIAQNDNLVCINSCVQVDLQGQVASESVGEVQISGSGGQVDFIRGAARARNGKSIIAINATARGGAVSKIVPYLDHGAAVTTLRTDVDYVVTEFGIAALRGKTLRARARALIDIAHPDFRGELTREYDRRFGVPC